MATDHTDEKVQSDDATKTAESLRLIQAFHAVESRPVREALIIIAEHLSAAGSAPRQTPKRN
jgi:hypothetical protein